MTCCSFVGVIYFGSIQLRLTVNVTASAVPSLQLQQRASHITQRAASIMRYCATGSMPGHIRRCTWFLILALLTCHSLIHAMSDQQALSTKQSAFLANELMIGFEVSQSAFLQMGCIKEGVCGLTSSNSSGRDLGVHNALMAVCAPFTNSRPPFWGPSSEMISAPDFSDCELNSKDLSSCSLATGALEFWSAMRGKMMLCLSCTACKAWLATALIN